MTPEVVNLLSAKLFEMYKKSDERIIENTKMLNESTQEEEDD